MTLQITDVLITSNVTAHNAVRQDDRTWRVTWTGGKALDRNQAVTAMMLAEAFTQRAPFLGLVVAWSAELNLAPHEVSDLLERSSIRR